MKHPYLTFLTAVLLPCGLVTAAAILTSDGAWRRVVDETHQRVASMALVAADAHAPELGPVLRMARTTGYDVAIYVNGTRVGGTADDFGADRWGSETSEERQAERASLQAGDIAVTTAPGTPTAALVSVPVLLVVGLLFVFAALAGWIHLARPRIEGTRPVGPTAIILPSLVPALTAVVLLVHVDRTFEVATRQAVARSLTLGLAGAVALGVESPAQMRGLTGFHVTRVHDGDVTESTLPEEGFASLAALPAPPPSFTSSGRVTTAEGPSLYAALRQGDDAFVVMTLPLPQEARAALRFRLAGMGILLGGWLALVAAFLAATGRGEDPEGIAS